MQLKEEEERGDAYRRVDVCGYRKGEGEREDKRSQRRTEG